MKYIILILLFLAASISLTTDKNEVFETAKQYLNIHETDIKIKKYLNNNLTVRINPKHTPWCAAFVNATLNKNNMIGTNKLTARSFLKWGKKVEKPRKGDILVFKRGKHKWQGHVGFYVREESKDGKPGYIVLGGNQDNKVKLKWYAKSRLIDIRRAK